MQHFQNFEYEIKINIFFKFVNSPLNLALTCRNWSVIAEWLIAHHGKAREIFYAARLESTFINITVRQTLTARKVITSSLLMHFGIHEVGRAFLANNLSVFTYLLDQRHKQLPNTNEDLPSDGNDTDATDPHVINYIVRMLRRNFKYIKGLALNQRFTPFPPRLQFQLNFNSTRIFQLPIPEGYSKFLQPRPITLSSFFINDVGVLRIQPSRNQRRNNQPSRRQRITNRIYNRRVRPNTPINNEDTLNRIANFPQQIVDDPLINQFFNGSAAFI